MWTVIWSICGSLRSVLAFKEKVVVAEKSLRILTENSNVCEKGAKVRHYTVLVFRSQWLSPVGCIHLVTQGVAQGHYIFISRLWGGRIFFPALTTKQTPISFIQNTKERKIRLRDEVSCPVDFFLSALVWRTPICRDWWLFVLYEKGRSTSSIHGVRKKAFLHFATHPNIASVLEDANAKKYVAASPLYVK